jgi:hypothetical protein
VHYYDCRCKVDAAVQLCDSEELKGAHKKHPLKQSHTNSLTLFGGGHHMQGVVSEHQQRVCTSAAAHSIACHTTFVHETTSRLEQVFI